MKTAGYINCLAIASLLLWGVFPYSATAQIKSELFATRDNSYVKLYWDCRAWGYDQMGFYIMRSPAGKEQWEELHEAPIVPSIDSLKNYLPQGVSDKVWLDSLANTYHKYLKEGKLVALSDIEMRDLLKYHNGLGAGDRIRMKSDFMLAVLMGFGCVDTKAIPEESYDYALYEVRLDGSVSPQPLDIFRLGELAPLLLEVDYKISKESVILEWKVPSPEIKAHANIGFKVERSDANSNKKTIIAAQPISSSISDTGVALFRFVDASAIPTNDYQYYLIPVNIFGKEESPITSIFIADKYRRINPPEIKMINLVEEKDIEVSWEINPEDETLIQGFKVEFSKEMSGVDAQLVSDKIDASVRTFVDRSPKRYGEAYYYRISAIGRYGQEATSAPEVTYYMGLISPPNVIELRSMPVKKDGKLYVNLVWAPKEFDDTITKGYFLYTDEMIPDSFLQITSLPLIQGNQTLYPINTQGGRQYRYRVAGVSEHGKAGKPSETSLYVGTLHLPKVTQIFSELLQGNNLLVSWKYPQYQDLKGFKLLVNEIIVASPDEISSDMRSYLLSAIPESEKGELKISIVAVGSETESELGFYHNVYIKDKKPIKGDAPQHMSYEYISKQEPEVIQLCWTPPFGGEDDILGYAIYNDYAGNEKLYRLNTVPIIRETNYIFTNKLSNRSSIILGVAAVYKDGSIGDIASVVIPLQEQEINNNQQR